MEWTPFYCLPKAELTPSGLIQLDAADHEVLLLRRQGVEFRHEGPTPMAPRPRGLPGSERWKPRSEASFVLTITTHRFFLQPASSSSSSRNNNNDDGGVDARFVHLSNVRSVVPTGGPSLLSPNSTHKIVLSTKTYDELVLVFRSGGGPDRDWSLKEFSKALERKRWEAATRLQEQRAKVDASLGDRVGLDKILAKNAMRHRQNARLAEDALSGDSENLLQEAAGLLRVIQKYTVLVQKLDGNDRVGGGDDGDDDAQAATKLRGLLSDMGMTSALSQSKVAGSVGKGFAGMGRSSATDQNLRDYHEVTARQVADFLIPKLRKRAASGKSSSGASNSGGMMSLTDVYCLFNRARGSNLISPEDLRASCALLGSTVKVGLSMRTFPSGVVVLQLDDLAVESTNYEARRALIDLCAGGRTALEASHVLKLSPLLASEQLEEAERLEWLCRDVTLSTVRFFPNKFATTF